MKFPRAFLAGLIAITFSATLFGQESTVYLSVLSTKLFVVGAANPQTGLFYKKVSDTVYSLAEKSVSKLPKAA